MSNFQFFKSQSSIRNRLLFQLGAVTFAISLSIFLVVRLVVVQAVTATQDGLLKVAVQSVTAKIYIVDEQVSVDFLAPWVRTVSFTGFQKMENF